MDTSSLLSNDAAFCATLFEKMKRINPGLAELEPYEFKYCLNNLIPSPGGWSTVAVEPEEEVERMVNSPAFYKSIQVKPMVDGQIVLDERIVRLSQMLLVGLATERYSEDWVKTHFYLDIRGFYFLHRTVYFTREVLDHLCRKPYRQFEAKQKQFESAHEVGYKAFKTANAEIDRFFIQCVQKMIAIKGTPIVLAIAGGTAAGKTEIVEQLHEVFQRAGQKTTSMEMDNFLTDREYREAKGIFSLGKEAIHFALFKRALEDLCQGKKVSVPRYDFIYATSSHDLQGDLKPGGVPIEIEPADIIFIEGNFPFLLKETVHLIGIKVFYLTDDSVRLKRKWRRDIDYRKKYDLAYLRNRFFKDQFQMNEKCYLPQMAQCDMVVDTTGAALWCSKETAGLLDQAGM